VGDSHFWLFMRSGERKSSGVHGITMLRTLRESCGQTYGEVEEEEMNFKAQ